MNAYPPELISHHFPLILLSGILPPDGSGSDSTTNDGLTPPTQAFSSLCADLRSVVASRGRETAWDPARGRSTAFKTVLVDESYRLSLPKSRPLPRGLTAPPNNETAVTRAWNELTAQPARSPLSPTHPASPLWPDGMIAPTWARRYREAVGAVWVMVAVLPSIQPEEDQEEEEELRVADETLIKAIADRKRSLSERGIKLTVVLLTQREMLDSPRLEPRLSHIRRSSTLDSKASLFVLTPVARTDLSAFLTSLHTALFPCAVDYYLEHARRLRRKRGRYPPSNSLVHDAVTALRSGGAHPPPPLGKEGWAVRAEYKLGTFVELAGDTPSALTHYVAAYTGILTLLRSTAALPPRTKRWAEAKVLADTLSLRIVRLYLYDGRAEEATRQFAEHMAKLGELSAGWGMGAESAEWWSWAGKQYRLMGDLTDLSLRQTQLPPLPLLTPALPAHLQHLPSVPSAQARGPAAFWFAAGLCAVERKTRFVKMKGEENDAAAGGGWSVLEHERKVNHAALIAEAFARSDDLAKRAGHSQTAPSLATSIASAHLEAGSAQLALRYLEGLLPSYTSTHTSDTAAVLLLLVKCAQQAGEVDAELKALLQVLRTHVALSPEQRETAGRELAALVQTKELSRGTTPIHIESTAHDGLLRLEAAFLASQTDLGAPAHFQVRLTAPPGSKIDSLTFDELGIVYEEDKEPIVVLHEQKDEVPKSQLVQLSTLALDAEPTEEADKRATADLRWAEENVLVLQGSLLADTARPARIVRVELKAGGARLPFHLSFTLPLLSSPQEPTQARWYSSASPVTFVYLPHTEDPTSVAFRRRPHRLSVSIEHAPAAYLDDATPVKVIVTNSDTEVLDVCLDAVLHSAPSTEAKDALFHPSTSTPTAKGTGLGGTLHDVKLGFVEPGEQRSETLFVRVQHALGLPRSLDVLVRSTPPSANITATTSTADADAKAEGETAGEASPEATSRPNALACETTHSVTLETRAMFAATHAASWRAPRGIGVERPRTPLRASLSLGGGEEDGASDAGDSFAFGAEGTAPPVSTVAELTSCIHIIGGPKVSLKSVQLKLDDASRHLRLEASSGGAGAGTMEEADQLAGEWSNGDRWGGMHEIEVLSSEDGAAPEALDGTVKPTGHLEVCWSRAEGEVAEQLNTTLLTLPVLLPPHLNARLLVAAPPVALVDQPFVALLTVVNPHPTLTADVYVGLDASDVFFLAGPRTLTIPSLVPRSTRSVPLRIVARTEGRSVLPRVRAWDKRQRFLQLSAELSVAPDATSALAPAQAAQAPPNSDQDNYGEPHAPKPTQGQAAMVVNERQGLGIPLSVRFRHSHGGGLSIGAQRALQAEAQAGGPRLPPALLNAERRGAALSVLVLRP